MIHRGEELAYWFSISRMDYIGTPGEACWNHFSGGRWGKWAYAHHLKLNIVVIDYKACGNRPVEA
jgi:hypothetical protein